MSIVRPTFHSVATPIVRVISESSHGLVPSAFDDIWGQWRSDTISGSSPTMQFTDLSGNGRHATQTAGTLTAGTGSNGLPIVTGNSTATLTIANGTLRAWPLTVFTVARRTAGSAAGFFGASGASPANVYWHGYETTNRVATYNLGGSLVTDTSTNDVFSACMLRHGYASAVVANNAMIQIPRFRATIANPTAVAPAIGTTYRGLNCQWQETLCWDRLLSISEIDEVNAYLNERYSLTQPLWSSYTPAPTVLMHGQSNSAGRGDKGVSNANIPVEYLGTITGANVWHGLAASNQADGTAFETLSNTVAKTGFTGNHMFGDSSVQPTSFIGCESALCKEYLDANGGSVYLNKYSLGGSALAETGSYWMANDVAQNTSARLFGFAGGNWWATMQAHQIASRRPDIKGWVWHQGEQDAANATHAGNYAANLAAFIAAYRTELGYPDAPMLLCRLHDECPETHTATVRAAQASVAAATRNCQMVDLDGFEPRSGDPVHLSTNGQIALGQYLATQI